ncbi:acylneuraminate cytidylyltransferase family protein [Candidatus Pelagibacter sp.]|uniref:acylneuraminate cytidylyltransferase family protein n=1 Tax=Candidatus Pelagibacter sp. TaxID=2024849 RepID=UPI003F85305B|tara:strand:- start:3549 stop:4292 length:744 start_codon:yes stop_codon:yes gene_type:complete
MNLKQKKEVEQTWAIIPARSNSKSIKNKNLQKIATKSLLRLTIDVAKKTKKIDKIFVSTEKKRILDQTIKWGSEVINLRKTKNARDFSTDIDVILDFFESWFKDNDIYPKYLIYLRPTTPLRNYKVLNKAIVDFKKLKNYDSMVSVNKTSSAYKTFIIKKNKYLRPSFKKMSLDDANKPRQSFKTTYIGNGYFDIIKTKNLTKKIFLGKKCFPFITKETIDIDKKKDLILARFIKKNKRKFCNYYEF